MEQVLAESVYHSTPRLYSKIFGNSGGRGLRQDHRNMFARLDRSLDVLPEEDYDVLSARKQADKLEKCMISVLEYPHWIDVHSVARHVIILY